MIYAGTSIGQTKKGKYKAYCLVSKDGTVVAQGNNLRAIAFKDQPVRGFLTVRELIDDMNSITIDTLRSYIGEGKAESKGVHLGTQEIKDVYVHSMLEWNGIPPKGPGELSMGWHLSQSPQLQFNFMYD